MSRKKTPAAARPVTRIDHLASHAGDGLAVCGLEPSELLPGHTIVASAASVDVCITCDQLRSWGVM